MANKLQNEKSLFYHLMCNWDLYVLYGGRNRSSRGNPLLSCTEGKLYAQCGRPFSHGVSPYISGHHIARLATFDKTGNVKQTIGPYREYRRFPNDTFYNKNQLRKYANTPILHTAIRPITSLPSLAITPYPIFYWLIRWTGLLCCTLAYGPLTTKRAPQICFELPLPGLKGPIRQRTHEKTLAKRVSESYLSSSPSIFYTQGSYFHFAFYRSKNNTNYRQLQIFLT